MGVETSGIAGTIPVRRSAVRSLRALVGALAIGVLGSGIGLVGVGLSPAALAQEAAVRDTGEVASCGLAIFVGANAAGVSAQRIGGRLVILADPSVDAATRAASTRRICEEIRAREAAAREAAAAEQAREERTGSGRTPPPAPPSPSQPGTTDGGLTRGTGGGVRGIVAPRPTPEAPEASRSGEAGPAGRGVALPDAYEIVSNVLLPTETYLPKADRMPTGVVLLDRRERTRNRELCNGLLGRGTARVLTQEAARARNPSGDFLVTNWLVREPARDQTDCAELLAKYDFTRATAIKQAYGLESRRGPILLAIDPTREMIFVDLADSTPEYVYEATNQWMRLALAAPQTGPDAGRPPRAQGLTASANRLFDKVAGGLASLVGGGRPTTSLAFNDPATGTRRAFQLYKAGVLVIGATFGL